MQNKRSFMFAGILTPSSISVVFEPFTNFAALPYEAWIQCQYIQYLPGSFAEHAWMIWGLLCRKAYSLITIDMQQTRRACFGCFVKTPACWRKLWWSVWWIEIHKMCFETEKSWVSLKSSRNLVNWSIGIQQTFGLSDKTSLYFFFVLSLL